MGWGRWRAALGLAALLVATTGYVAHAEWDPNPVNGFSTATSYACGAHDNPERGIQGDVGDTAGNAAYGGFNCGLSLVGHATLDADGREPTGNANMAWAGDCAYVAGPMNVSAVVPDAPSSEPPAGGGVAVVYVPPAHPDRPVHVRTLRDPGAAATSETIAAITTTTGRSILVVGQYGNTARDASPLADSQDPLGNQKPMDVYDVTQDCRNPVHLATFQWPLNIHNLTITKDGRYVIATQPLQVLDISPLWATPKGAPVWLGNLDKAMEGPQVAVGPMADLDDAVPGVNSLSHPNYTSHEAFALQEHGRTKLYLGGQLPVFELMTIVDITKWLDRSSGAPAGAPEILSQQSGRGHSVRMATIHGTRYLLHSEESPFGAGYSCAPETANPFAGAAQPWLTNIGDEHHPKLVSQMGLAINLPERCPTQLQHDETNSVHYHDVDDPDDTTFVMASMWNSGIRIFDVRDPVHPTEVGYFNPGDLDKDPATANLDHVWGHIRYLPSKGQIWFASASGGFWVVQIERGLRDRLGLDAKLRRHGTPTPPVVDALGAPGWRNLAARFSVPLSLTVDVAPYYCTLGKVDGLR